MEFLESKNKNIVTESYLNRIIRNWLLSNKRKECILGKEYYAGKQDILFRKRTAIGKDGNLEVLKNVPNNRLVDNQYRKLIDQKTDYILSKPLTISSENEEYLNVISSFFTKDTYRKLRILARYSIEGGIAWLYPYCDEEGNFQIDVFHSTEICPVWEDKLHTKLKFAMRYYVEEVIDEYGKSTIEETVQLFKKDGIEVYNFNNHILKKKGSISYIKMDNNPIDWGEIPLIPFKYNDSETPLIRNVKCLQDSLNNCLSDFQNNMEEDSRNTILVVKNYQDTNSDGVRGAINSRGIIGVTTIDGVSGGVEALRITIDEEVYKSFLMQIKRAIIENGRGFDAKEERMDGDPNQMNIESMYTDIDLDVNALESEFQAGFEKLTYFINKFIYLKDGKDFSGQKVEFIFNRDIFINEDAKIDSCSKSKGIISLRTIVSRHPWTTSLEEELRQIKKEEDEEIEKMQADGLSNLNKQMV